MTITDQGSAVTRGLLGELVTGLLLGRIAAADFYTYREKVIFIPLGHKTITSFE